MTSLIDCLFARLIASVVRRATLWIILYLALISGSVYGCFLFLGVDTDSSRMLSSELDFQKRTLAFNGDFPDLKNALIIVIRADTPDIADANARILVDKLKASDRLRNVFSPSVDPFFLTHGLLYQDSGSLEKNLDQLNKSASLLASLREQPTLETFFLSLYTAEELADKADFDRRFLDDFYQEVTRSIEGRLSGRFTPLSWARANQAVRESDDNQNKQIQRLVYATPVLDFAAIQPAKEALRVIEMAIADLPEDLKTASTIGVTGDPVLRFEELKSVSTGIGLSFALSLALMGILLFFAFRLLAHIVLTFVALFAALVLSTGFAAVSFGDLNLVSVAFIVLLVGLGLDFTIHVLLHLKDENHPAAETAIIAVGRSIGSALFLSALTTAIAFLSFVPTDFSGMRQLGILGAGGVMIALVVSFTLVPALLTRIGWFYPKDRMVGLLAQGQPSALMSFFIAQRNFLAVLLLLAGIGGLFFAGEVRFDADPVALRDPQSPSMQTLALLQERAETVPYRLSLLRADEAQAKSAQAAVAKLETVQSARILSDLVPTDQEEKLGLIDLAIPAFDGIVNGTGLDPATLPKGESALAALQARLQPATQRPLAVRFAAALADLSKAPEATRSAVEKDIFRFFPDLISTIKAQMEVQEITLDALPDFFSQRFRGQDGRWRVDVVPREDMRNPAALQRFVESVEAFDAEAIGPPLQIAKAANVVSQAMVIALSIAGFAILAITFALLRRLRTVAAIFLPLLLAGVLTAAASVVFNIPFNYANIIVLPLIIGLGVDSGIHVAMRREMVESTDALFATSTPRGVLFSGLTTIAAFGTLAVSDHRGTASMGQMLAIAISVTLLSSMILTPILMDFFNRTKK